MPGLLLECLVLKKVDYKVDKYGRKAVMANESRPVKKV